MRIKTSDLSARAKATDSAIGDQLKANTGVLEKLVDKIERLEAQLEQAVDRLSQLEARKHKPVTYLFRHNQNREGRTVTTIATPRGRYEHDEQAQANRQRPKDRREAG